MLKTDHEPAIGDGAGRAWWRSVAIGGALLTLLASGAGRTAAAAGTPRIVNGLTTTDFPTTGALLHVNGAAIDADNAFMECSGALIGCRSFLTAAHCVASDPDPTHYWVHLQNAGLLPVASLSYNPGYAGSLSGNDVAIVHLASDVTGIEPSPINSTHDLNVIGVGLPGTIVGFGLTVVPGRDFGVKRYGVIQTANCVPSATGSEGNDKLVCWDFAIPVGPPGQDSDTCGGDSGGPLFIDFGGSVELAGVTSSGSSPFCRPLDHAWDASVYYNAAWIAAELGTDSTATCGGIGPVGTPAAAVDGRTATLSAGHLSDSFTLDLPATTSVLRIALNGEQNGTFNPDLYVKAGTGVSPSSYDCKADGLSVYGACEISGPTPGTWSVLVVDTSGAGTYQVVSTAFAAAGCGDGVVEAGEACDAGADNGTPASCCTAACRLQTNGVACADDGNACTTDVCNGISPICQHPSGNAGAVCRAAADVCDLAESCDGVSPLCPADVRSPDTDGDGACDAVDPCTNVAHGQDFITTANPRLVFANVNTDTTAGNDWLRLGAAFQLAVGDAFATIDPSAHGARLLVTDRTGTKTLVDVHLAAAPFGGNHTRGWKINRPRTLWTYRDATGSPLDGITTMRIRDTARRSARRVSIAVGGAKGDYPVLAGDEPLRVAVVLGDQSDAAGGFCGESAFVNSDCAFNRKGNTLSCKQ